MSFTDFIRPEFLILIPVLYLIGTGIKKSKLPDNLIPLMLGTISVLICALWVMATSDIEDIRSLSLALFTAITQGVLTAGAGVYFNQLYIQLKKKTQRKE